MNGSSNRGGRKTDRKRLKNTDKVEGGGLEAQGPSQPGQTHDPRSQEVINPPQTCRMMCMRVCVSVRVWGTGLEESGVGCQSLSSFPKALPKSGVINP